MKYSVIVKEVNEILQQYHTRMTLRQIYYRLVAKLIIPNTISQYKGLSKILVKAREQGEVEWYMIEDRARVTIGGDYADDEEDSFREEQEETFRDSWRNFTLSFWGNQPKYIEVWVEKDALSRIVSETADRKNVRTCPSRGYSSFSYVASAVQRLNRYEDKEKVVLYLGDYDPSGLDITRDLRDRLFRYGANVTVKRLALSREQIEEYNLPPMPAKHSDPRINSFIALTGTDEAVELDALEPPILAKIIEDGIAEEIDLDLWEERQEEIKDTRNRLKVQFENLEIEW